MWQSGVAEHRPGTQAIHVGFMPGMEAEFKEQIGKLVEGKKLVEEADNKPAPDEKK